MKVHRLAATDTQTNIREVLTQTVQIRFSLRLLRLIGYTALLGTMGVSASWAGNCTGYDAGVTQSAETTDLGHGLKQTSRSLQSICKDMNFVICFSRMACGGGNDGCEGDFGKEVCCAA